MSIVVGFQCDGSTPSEPGFSERCTVKHVRTDRGSSYIAATESAKDLETRLKQQGWRFLGGYCYCPEHAK